MWIMLILTLMSDGSMLVQRDPRAFDSAWECEAEAKWQTKGEALCMSKKEA